MQRRVVELQFGQRIAQRFVLIRLDREQAREYLGLRFLEARQRHRGRLGGERDRVADVRIAQLLDAGDHEAHGAGRELPACARLRREHADLLDQMRGAARHQQNLVARSKYAIEHAHQHDHADVVVEPGVDDQRLQRRVRISLRCGDALDDAFQNLVDALPRFRADAKRVGGIDPDDVLDLGGCFVGICRGQIHLVQHRQHFDAELERGVAVGHRLCFDSLRRVDHQQSAFASGE